MFAWRALRGLAALSAALGLIFDQVASTPQDGLDLQYAPQWGWHSHGIGDTGTDPFAGSRSQQPQRPQQRQPSVQPSGPGIGAPTQYPGRQQYLGSVPGSGGTQFQTDGVAPVPTYMPASGPGTYGSPDGSSALVGQRLYPSGTPAGAVGTAPGRDSLQRTPQPATTTYQQMPPALSDQYPHGYARQGWPAGFPPMYDDGGQRHHQAGQVPLTGQQFGQQTGLLPGQLTGLLPGQQTGMLPGQHSGLLPGQHSGLLPGQQTGLLPGQQTGMLPGQHSGLLPGQQTGLLPGQTGQIAGQPIGQQTDSGVGGMVDALTNLLASKVTYLGSAVRGGVNAVLWLPGVILDTLRGVRVAPAA